MTVDEIVRAEEIQIERFQALGLGRYDAIEAVDAGVDVQTVDRLVSDLALMRGRQRRSGFSGASSRKTL